MDDETTGHDLLAAWQDTMLATDLAERLAKSALDAADRADRGAAEAEAIAVLAEQAARAADVVASTARAAADRARHRAADVRTLGIADADADRGQARRAQDSARDRWGAGTREDPVTRAEAGPAGL